MRCVSVVTAALLVTLTGPGCSRSAHPASPKGSAAITPEVTESGLEAMTFVCGADEQTLARALAAGAERDLPVSHSVVEAWAAHGFRLVAVPSEQVTRLADSLRTSGGTQKQWLGQAYTWTEIVRGATTQSRVVALDAERIRLPAGTLRMLARSWIEPSAAGAGANEGPSATLHVELVPQNHEVRRAEDEIDPLALGHPSIEAEGQGMLFSRLLASMGLRQGESLLIVPERPDADWKRIAAEEPVKTEAKAADAGAGAGPPKVGQVVRGARSGTARSGGGDVVGPSVLEGPSGPRVLTLGEAMMLVEAGETGRNARNAQRTILVLTARVPKEFRLLPSAPAAVPVSPAGGATRSGESERRG